MYLVYSRPPDDGSGRLRTKNKAKRKSKVASKRLLTTESDGENKVKKRPVKSTSTLCHKGLLRNPVNLGRKRFTYIVLGSCRNVLRPIGKTSHDTNHRLVPKTMCQSHNVSRGRSCQGGN